VMETVNWPREHFMQLRDRHIHMVEEHGFGPDYDRRELGNYFLVNWNRLFGTLRKSKALEVPSDQLRKGLMIARLLELIEMRRAEYAEERASYGHHTNTSFAFARKYGDADYRHGSA
jgi:hypothetical protein